MYKIKLILYKNRLLSFFFVQDFKIKLKFPEVIDLFNLLVIKDLFY